MKKILNMPLVPARSGSKGIRHKNLRKIGGIPLLVRSLNHAKQMSLSTKPLVSSDSLNYLRVCQTYFPESKKILREFGDLLEFRDFFFHHRSMEDGADHALIGDLLSKVVHKLETDWAGCSLENMKTITMLQPTTPFRTQDELSELLPSHFQRVIGDNRSLVSLKSVEEVHPSRMYLPSDDGIMRSLGALNAEERLPRQNLTPVYIRDGAYYVMPLHTARLGLSFGSDFIGFIRDGARTINIDSLEHLILSKHYLKTSLVKGDPNDINR